MFISDTLQSGFYRPVFACIFLLLLTLSQGAVAHDTPVALLTINEGSNQDYWLEWTYYSSRSDTPPGVEWPENCQEDYPRLVCTGDGLLGEVVMPEIGEKYSAAVVQIRYRNQPTHSYTLTGGNPRMVITADGKIPWQKIAASYIPLGIEHIMLGIDHLLFVIGLMLLVANLRSLFATITSFTLAHSITLAAATLGWVGVPEKTVNATIALSIVILAVEIIKYRRGEPCLSARIPWAIAFGFGLLHGFGFAGAMNDIGLPAEALPAALLFFNVGVEIGQIGFVLTLLGLYKAHQILEFQAPRWSSQIGIYGMGSIASYWFISRLFMLVSP